ncbi:MAG: MBL fold metallo-hydrolase [Clostridiales bacterium]|nr:MBL fold metallo-hydrolase [Candidatus Crickella equi]
MRIVSIGSSSSGNSYIVQAGSKNLLIDVGLSATKIISALESCKIDPEEIDAVLVTHEHIDHVKSVRTIAKKCPNADFYASRGTVAGCSNFEHVPENRLEIVKRHDIIEFGDAKARVFRLSHDANEPVGYSVIADGEQLTVVTDTGTVTDEIYQEMRSADVLVMEANHEEGMLMYGDYPYKVKMRIKSDLGHLSNVSTGELLARLLDDRSSKEPLTIMLAHLSDKNNTPYQARMTIEDILREHGYERDEDYYLSIAAKEGLCEPR